MRTILLLLPILLLGVGISAQNITRIEYFIDSDPGYGSATTMSGFTAATVVNNVNLSIPIGSLTNGIHKLYVRAKNANGKWSFVSNHLFFKDQVPATIPNITFMEYFLDTDPGFGKATSVTLTAGTTITDKSFTVPMTSLAKGIHRLYVRAKDANGKWSVVSSHLFFNDVLPAALPNITKVEYFIDTDPGYGVGANVPVTAGIALNNLNFDVVVKVLPVGTHKLFIRAKNASGKWSMITVKDFKTTGTSNGRPSFAAQKQGTAVSVDWEINSAPDSTGFEILEVQQSKDGNEWLEIENVAFSGQENVGDVYLHANPSTGVNFYRLKMLDSSGKLTYSKTVFVKFENKDEVTVYPNPASDKTTITSEKPLNGYKLFKLNGELVEENAQLQGRKTFEIQLNLFPAGVYVVQILCEDEQIIYRKLLVIK